MKIRLREIRQERGLTLEQLAQLVGTSNQQISMLEQGKRRLTADWMRKLSKALGVNLEELIVSGDVVNGTKPRKPQPPASEVQRPATQSVPIAEIDVRAGMGAGGEALLHYVPDGNGGLLSTDAVAARWEMPAEYIASELRVRANNVSILPVAGDSMEPTLLSGDRVMVDLGDRRPSPPGIFALWDGIGVVVKRVEYIPNSDPPTVVISSDNPKHRMYERTADEIRIIGRVIWYGRRL
ncbi:MAG TPA: helix-turn-helix domain-containing protein [Kaistia sp.]|jgi:transcriptional regulator with XRE-family HTH domain|nr:helix-turn-helix domain-containing protein [Kaistia sp.]